MNVFCGFLCNFEVPLKQHRRNALLIPKSNLQYCAKPEHEHKQTQVTSALER